MAKAKKVLVVGVEPTLADFSHFPGLTAENVWHGLNAGKAELEALGYEVQFCIHGLGETAAAVLTKALSEDTYDCIMIGAGVRAVPANLHLFETLVNTAHHHAPNAKFCFNTKPSDTAAAVQRWI